MTFIEGDPRKIVADPFTRDLALKTAINQLGKIYEIMGVPSVDIENTTKELLATQERKMIVPIITTANAVSNLSIQGTLFERPVAQVPDLKTRENPHLSELTISFTEVPLFERK